MRRATLEVLRCPRCQTGSLVPDAPVAEPAMIFGPVRCLGCAARFPVAEGMVDFAVDRHAPALVQLAMEQPWIARSWEHYVRPAVGAVLTRGQLDRESEYTVLHFMVGYPQGPVVDLGCGSGFFARRLARDLPETQIIGVDLSRPMLEEALAQVRERGLSADFVRAQVPPLPFADASVGGIVAAGLVHYIADLDTLLREATRALRPGGRFVASTYDARAFRRLHEAAGLNPRSETQLREACDAVGLVRFERMKTGPVLVWKAELP